MLYTLVILLRWLVFEMLGLVIRFAMRVLTSNSEPPSFPEPVISMSIEPKTKGDQERMANALQRL